MNQYIEPEVLKGTRDFLPLDMAKRDFVMKHITSVFRSFGYDSVQTPAIEYAKTILGKYGEDSDKLIYRFKDNGGRDIALRYDQTVPFARLVAANFQNLPIPFKRYQVGNVWRGDRPAKGRYREFCQCDIDIIGTKNLLAEAEIAKVVYSVLARLGFPKFVIKFNSRRFLNSVLSDLKIAEEKQVAVIRILDKFDRIGLEGVEIELNKILSKETISALRRIINLEGSNSEKINSFKKYDTAEILQFLQLTKSLEIPECNLQFTPSLARGLDYYTGITFEVFIPGADIGAVCAGGRYDNLCELFTSENLSGVGVAFGFDRIVIAMEQLGMLKKIRLSSRVLITYFEAATLPASLEVFNELTSEKISAEIYFEPAPLKKQLKYADKKGIPFVIFLGEEEIRKQQVKIKFMDTGKEKVIPRDQISIYLKCFYEQTEK
ncbi:MAG: histidine--tRNA ligase [Candidatus Gracilibacteria bacterium]|jgi:histidyl-tRNA synthetase